MQYPLICKISQRGSRWRECSQSYTQNSEKCAIFEVSPRKKDKSCRFHISHTYIYSYSFIKIHIASSHSEVYRVAKMMYTQLWPPYTYIQLREYWVTFFQFLFANTVLFYIDSRLFWSTYFLEYAGYIKKWRKCSFYLTLWFKFC